MDDISAVIVVSVLIGLAVAVIACLAVVYRYKNKLQSPIYPIEKYTSLSLVHSSDRFIGRTVTKVRVASSRKKD